MNRTQIVHQIQQQKVVAILRLKDTSKLLHVMEALLEGGVVVQELTLTMPQAMDLIEAANQRFGDAILLGVGSVLDSIEVQQAVHRGAKFVVSPIFDPRILEESHRLHVPYLAGAFTPSEIHRAAKAGSDIVKVFPAEFVSPAYFKAVLAPMPFLKMMPTGGVTPENIHDWLNAGACAVGVGSALLDPKLIESENWAELTEIAKRMTA